MIFLISIYFSASDQNWVLKEESSLSRFTSLWKSQVEVSIS